MELEERHNLSARTYPDECAKIFTAAYEAG